MIRQTVKEAFGGEVNFTKFIADNPEVYSRLLDVADLSITEDCIVTPEDHTIDNKRVDLTVTNEDNEVIAVIESQDCSGWLDSVHASKITYYMYDKNCNVGILLAEDSDEKIKGYVRYLNETTQFDIFLLTPVIYNYNKETLVDFIPVMRPVSLDKKRVTVKKGNHNNNYTSSLKEKWLPFLSKKKQEHGDLFTHLAEQSVYLSRNNIGPTNINALISPYKTSIIIEAYHKKHDTELFRETFTKFCQEHGFEPSINSKCGKFKVNTNWDEAFEAFMLLKEALEKEEVKCYV